MRTVLHYEVVEFGGLDYIEAFNDVLVLDSHQCLDLHLQQVDVPEILKVYDFYGAFLLGVGNLTSLIDCTAEPRPQNILRIVLILSHIADLIKAASVEFLNTSCLLLLLI